MTVGDQRIEDYAFLSDCHSAALVDRGGNVEWLCFPRFDSPSVFARILGADAGFWSLTPSWPWRSHRRYIDETLVLRTEFTTDHGTVTVTDALALAHGVRGHDVGQGSPHVLLRRAQCLDGDVEVATEFAPRLEYGLTTPHLDATGSGVVASAGPTLLRLTSSVPLEIHEGTVQAAFTLRAGEAAAFSLSWAAATDGFDSPPPDVAVALDDTQRAWKSWTEMHQGYQGRYRELVRRSAVVLKGLTYQPTGAVVAAATSSLPERLGGDANWDYRFAWLRDVSFTMRALWVAACPHEADRFLQFLAHAAGQPEDTVQIVYAVDGQRDLTEHVLGHLGGFADSRPVRVGNDAWQQRQLDVMGEVLSAAYVLREQLGDLDRPSQQLLVALADHAAGTWHEPDAGMWEARDRRRHYLSSKVLCWVALDRAVKFADRLGPDADPQRWSAARQQVRQAVLGRGWSDTAGAYTGAFDSDQLDASVLIMPLLGFLPADHPRMRATIAAVERQLGHGGMIHRWQGEAAGFVMCSYWLVECLALLGDLDRATRWFDDTTAYANDVGLLSEMADTERHALLGNTPQAFSHVGLINAAWRLTQAAGGAHGDAVADADTARS